MAIVPNRPAAVARRVTTYALVTDVVLALLVGIFISTLIGVVLFVAGLVTTGYLYYNFNRVLKTKGLSRR